MKNIIYVIATMLIFTISTNQGMANEKICTKEKKIYKLTNSDQDQFALAVCCNMAGEVSKSLNILESRIKKDKDIKRVILKLGITENRVSKIKDCDTIKDNTQISGDKIDSLELGLCYKNNGDIKKYNEILHSDLVPLVNKYNALKRVNLELGAAYFKNRQYKKAQNTLEKTLSYQDLPIIARANVNNILKTIDNIKTFGGSITVGGGKNDNINSGTYSDTVDILGTEIETSSLGSSSAISTKTTNYGVNVYKKFFLNKNFDVNLVTNYTDIHYEDNRNYDLRVVNPVITTTFNAGSYESKLSSSFSKVNLAHKKYSNNYSVTSSHQYNFYNYFVPKYSFSLAKMDYDSQSNDPYKGKSKQHDLSLKFNIIVKNNFYGYISPYYSRLDSNLESEVHSYVSNKYGISYLQKMPFNIFLSLNYYKQDKAYDKESAIFLAKKDSDVDNLSASMSRKFFKNFTTSLTYSKTQQDSDVRLLKYKKEQYGFNISYGF